MATKDSPRFTCQIEDIAPFVEDGEIVGFTLLLREEVVSFTEAINARWFKKEVDAVIFSVVNGKKDPAFAMGQITEIAKKYRRT